MLDQSLLSAKVAYAAAASVLNNRDIYRSFFRVLPSFDNLPLAVVAIMDNFKWSQMLVFTQEESLFISVSDFGYVHETGN